MKNEAGGENLAIENEQKRRESSTRTTEELPTENLHHGRQQEVRQSKEQLEAQDTEKSG